MLRRSVKILVNDITVNDLCQFMVMSSEIEFCVFKSHQNRFLRLKLCNSGLLKILKMLSAFPSPGAVS